MKCSGEATGCIRCIRQSITCHYSIQKQMGRPPKKRMREDEDTGLDNMQGDEPWLNLGDSQSPPFNLGESNMAPLDPPGLFPQVYFAPVRIPHAFPHLHSTDGSHNHPWQAHNMTDLEPLPATSSPWPDFSSVSESAPSPFTRTPESSADGHSFSQPTSDGAVPQCSCLSSLYLCLSQISSLSTFPISQHTLCSLFIGAKTARDVIRCKECPKTYMGGMQNVMLTGTLLNIITDVWLRVSKTDPVELGRQSTSPAYVASLTQTSSDTAESWKQWLRQTVRKAVIGGPVDPAGHVRCSDCSSLLSLVIEFEERQRRWYSEKEALEGTQKASSKRHAHASNDSGKNESGENHLCLRIVGTVREAIAKFEFAPHEYPNGVVL